jgi:hypothetical protein
MTFWWGIPLFAYYVGEEICLEKPYSRHLELEADYLGATLMARAGYDPQAAIDFWRDMAEEDKAKALKGGKTEEEFEGEDDMHEFFSTHPSHEHRSESLEEINDYLVGLYDEARGVGVKHWTDWARPPRKDPIAGWAKKLQADARRRK